MTWFRKKRSDDEEANAAASIRDPMVRQHQLAEAHLAPPTPPVAAHNGARPLVGEALSGHGSQLPGPGAQAPPRDQAQDEPATSYSRISPAKDTPRDRVRDQDGSPDSPTPAGAEEDQAPAFPEEDGDLPYAAPEPLEIQAPPRVHANTSEGADDAEPEEDRGADEDLPYAAPEPLQVEEDEPAEAALAEPDQSYEDLDYAEAEPVEEDAEEAPDEDEQGANLAETLAALAGQADEDEQAPLSAEDDEDEQAPEDEDPDQGDGYEDDDQEEEEDEDLPSDEEVATSPEQAPVKSSQETRQLLRAMKKQEKLRAEQEMAEAKALEQQAKQLLKDAKERQKLKSELKQHTEKVRHLAPELGLDPNRPIAPIPKLEGDHLTQVEFTTVKEGRAYVRVVFNTKQNRYLYQVIEPQLTGTEREVLTFLRDTLVRTLEARPGLDEEELEEYLAEAIDRAILDHSILVDDISRERLKYYLLRDFLGYGPIDVLMQDPMIEDISCDGPDIPVYLFHRQYESIRTNISFRDDYELDSFVIRLAQRCGKHISIAEPILDATLPDTSRLQATLSREVTTRGSSFTIRKFRADPLTPPDLVRLGTLSSAMAAWYWLSMEEGMSLIMAGGTASGKTTTLNSVCQFVPPDRKVVSIEDTREINLIHENWIAGLTRSGFGGEGTGGRAAGAVDMYKLLEAALRQRPEYLLVGEVRGPEAKTLFQAMATGHATYSTLHADSVKSAVYRLENQPINVPRIMLQTLDSVSVQVQARINQRMVRRIKEVTEIVGIDPDTGDLLTNTVFKWDAGTDTHRFYGKSQILEQIAEKNNLSLDDVMNELRNRQRVIDWMVEKGIRHIADVSEVLSAYYAKPDLILDQIGAEGRSGLRMASNRRHEEKSTSQQEGA